jgi:hypothetical protein
MTEQQQESPTTETQVAETPQEGEKAVKTYDEDYVKALRAEAAKYRTQAKTAQTEAERTRQASMSEAEKAIADARAEGRSEATTNLGKRLVRTEFDALAGRRNANFDTEAALEYLDLTKFIGEDGETDVAAIKAAVERLVPAAPTDARDEVAASLDLGTRGTSASPAGSPADEFASIIRRQLGT